MQSKMFLLAAVALVPVAVGAQNKTYTVRQGDTISGIASRLKVRSSELVAINALANSHLLQPGMVLRVPSRKPEATPLAAPQGAKYYTVRNGDYDWSLARRHGLSIAQLKALNPGVDFERLQIGTRIALPRTGTAATKSIAASKPIEKVAAKPATAKPAKEWTRPYKVKSGDFDWILAKRAGVTLAALKAANPGVNLAKLQIGQTIRIPGAAAEAAPSTSRVAKASPIKQNITTAYAQVVGNGSTIRRSPGVNGDKVTVVDAGTRAKVLDHENGWYKLKFPKGTVGWMRGDLLTPASVQTVAKERSRERVVRAAAPKRSIESSSAPRNRVATRTQATSSGRASLPIVDTTNSVIKTAYAELGKRYIWGSTNRSNGGFDCSGLVNYAYRTNGVKLPRTSREMANVGQKVDVKSLKPGDLVFFNTRRSSRINHVGMYVGNGKFIHSSSGQGGVRIDSVTSGYYARKLVTARRVAKSAASAKPAPPKAEPKGEKPAEPIATKEESSGE